MICNIVIITVKIYSIAPSKLNLLFIYLFKKKHLNSTRYPFEFGIGKLPKLFLSQ